MLLHGEVRYNRARTVCMSDADIPQLFTQVAEDAGDNGTLADISGTDIIEEDVTRP